MLAQAFPNAITIYNFICHRMMVEFNIIDPPYDMLDNFNNYNRWHLLIGKTHTIYLVVP